MELKDIRVSFVGFGNIAHALAKGFIKAGMPPKNITACAKTWDKLTANAEKLGIIPCRDVYEAAYYSDMVFIAVKPDQVELVLEDHKEVLHEKAVISVAAGLDFNWYEEFLLENTQHISILPNTACEVNKGVILREKTNSLEDDIAEKADVLLKALGHVEEVDNKLMEIGSSISGCTPAFVYMYIDALSDGAVKYGMTRDMAHRLVAKVFEGASLMLEKTGKHPGVLKDEICSPGGDTISGVAALEASGFRNSVIKAIDGTMERSTKTK
ncbi:pyrroline-5-carboxylate reductase [Eubacteriales bacterium KG125]